jgi:hypothetical protein
VVAKAKYMRNEIEEENVYLSRDPDILNVLLKRVGVW